MTTLTSSDKVAADMIAVFFAGISKTQEDLREAITALDETSLFDGSLNVEAIARHNEATQGVRFDLAQGGVTS